MRSRHLGLVVLAIAVLLLPMCNVEACGPWFEPDLFVSNSHPDDLSSFAKGQLGILQSGFDSNEYAVAYRYLNGGRLSDTELHSYVPQPSAEQTQVDWTKLTPAQIAAAQEAEKQARQNAQPAGQWLLVRAKYVSASVAGASEPSFPTNFSGNIVFDEGYLNCPDPAFQNATFTLNKRANTWGKQSPWLLDWIHAQDAVFSNCDGKTIVAPAPAPADSPALLQSDRAYQIASTSFYEKHFDEAAQQFAAIASDKNSPWSQWGQYLAARATVRKAFASAKATDPYSGNLASYDPDIMHRAQQILEALLSQPDPAPSRAIIQSELNFIRIRTEPDQRAAEICAALAGPAPDANFDQDLRDLSWILIKQIKVQDPSPLLAWITAWRGTGTSADAYKTWQQVRALPWLLIAIAKAAPTDSFAPDLISAAAGIRPGTPAYDTVFYHRVRLLIGLKRNDEARALLDAALPTLRNQKPSSNLNALLGERMSVSRTFDEFLTYAPRFALSTGSEGAEDLQGQCNFTAQAENQQADCPSLKQPLRFDQDAVTVLNRQLPLNLLIEAATSPSMPQNLRQDLAVMTWTRSIMLEDSASAAKIAPLLPKGINQVAGNSIGFPADLAILRNPGIRPYLEPGVSRVASFSYFDQLRDNWWCKPWEQNDNDANQPSKSPILPNPALLTLEQKALADSEYQRMQQLPDSVALIGQRVIGYGKDHPDDAEVPEALALTVRAGHYACQDWRSDSTGEQISEYTPVGKAAFQLLHSRYPKSPWALKTRYYY
jgi:hypothetical protein